METEDIIKCKLFYRVFTTVSDNIGLIGIGSTAFEMQLSFHMGSMMHCECLNSENSTLVNIILMAVMIMGYIVALILPPLCFLLYYFTIVLSKPYHLCSQNVAPYNHFIQIIDFASP